MVQDAAEVSKAKYATAAWRARRAYRVSETLLVVFGAAIPVSIAITSNPIFPAVLGGAVVVVTGLRRIFNWQENWARFTGVCAELVMEHTKFQHHREPYNKDEHKENEALLAMKVRDIETAETHSWLVLRERSTTDTK